MSQQRADYVGLDQFVWWHGVVEDIKDPLKLGRVRVRVLGWHTDNKTQFGIPTEDLPWAQVMQPATSAAMTGLGRSPTGILPGSWVIGFFLDGKNAQQPLVMGTYGGIQKPDYPADNAPFNDINLVGKKITNPYMNLELGFRDPKGYYPLLGRMNEPDTNRLVRNENIDWTIVQKKNDSRSECDTALYGYWKEPPSPYAAVYPHNHVTETTSGHIFEVDDTPGHERIHNYHKSGTFTEIHPNGSEVHKVVGNEWNITLNDRMIYVRGNTTLNSDKLLKIRVGKHLEIETEGEMRVLVKGNTVMETQGNFLHKVLGKYTVASDGGMLFVAPRIDFNPQGSSATKIKTLLTKLRSTIKRVFSRAPQPTQPPPAETPTTTSSFTSFTAAQRREQISNKYPGLHSSSVSVLASGRFTDADVETLVRPAGKPDLRDIQPPAAQSRILSQRISELENT